jgi:hypothetical protein
MLGGGILWDLQNLQRIKYIILEFTPSTILFYLHSFLILREKFSAVGMLLATTILCSEATGYFVAPIFDRFY